MFKKSPILLVLSLLISLIAFAQPSLADNAGETIFSTHCVTCHSPAMAPMMKAPAVHDAQSWNKFIEGAIKDASAHKVTDCAALTKSSSDTSKMTVSDADVNKLTTKEKACYLLPVAVKGRTSNGAIMPPKGNCMNCKDSDLRSAIEFMLTDKK